MIRQLDFKRQWAAVARDVLAAVERVGSSGRYILGTEVEQFEQALAQSAGVGHAVGVANGMDALEIALRCLGLRPGQKVLTTPFSAFASTLAILRAGGVPVFVDVDRTANIDLGQCRELLARDRSIRFFLPVHLYGHSLDLEDLGNLRDEFELQVVEDCAQAIGARHAERPVGTIGQASGTSFYPTNNLGAMGDGGALMTNDSDVASRAKMLRNYGQSSVYSHDEAGLNSRFDELQAAIVRDALLPNLQQWTERRRSIAARYRAELQNPLFQTLPVNKGAEPVWHLFPLFATNRDRLRTYLSDQHIESAIHYPRVIPDQKALQHTPHEIAVEPVNARNLAGSELSLPIHPFLTEEEVGRIITSLNSFAG